jgi:hypothetical protein
MIEALPEIETTLKGKGIALPRPEYGADWKKPASKDEADEDEEEDGPAKIEDAKPAISRDQDDDDEEEVPKPVVGRLDRFRVSKRNHEATSDEDN